MTSRIAFACAAFGAAVIVTSPLAAQQAGEVTGTFGVIWGDPRTPADSGVMAYTLTTDDGRMLVLRAAEDLFAPHGGGLALQGRRVSVSGGAPAPAAAAGLPAIGGTPYVVRSVRPAPLLQPFGAAARATGAVQSKPYITLLCRFADFDVGLLPVSHWEAETGMNQHGAGHFWLEASHGQIDMTGSRVAGWFTLPHGLDYYVPSGTNYANLNLLAQDCAAAADSAVHFPDYAGVSFQFNTGIGCCAWGGSGGLNLDGVSRGYGMTWIGGDWLSGTYMHEIGHTFGLPHSSGPYGLVYDSHWDVMSVATAYQVPGTEVRWGALPLAHQKDRLGVIPAERRFVAPQGRSAIMLERSAAPAANGNHLLAIIPIRGSSTTYYSVEARRRTGYDVAIPGEGVVIAYHGTPAADPQVVDADLNVEVNDAGATWTVGETFHDRGNDIRVRVDSQVGEGYGVTIERGRWTAIAIVPAAHHHAATAGTDTVISDSAFVSVTGPDSGGVAWATAAFSPYLRLLTPGGTGPGWVRWEVRSGTLGATKLVSSVSVGAVALNAYLTIRDTLDVVAPATGLMAGFARRPGVDTVAAGVVAERYMTVMVSGPGADSTAWSLASSSARLDLQSSAGLGGALVQYTRNAAGLAPGLYVDSVRLTFAGGAGSALLVDSMRVVTVPVATVTRTPGIPHVRQEGQSAADSVWVQFAGEHAATAVYDAFTEGTAPYLVTSGGGVGSGWLRFIRRAGSLAPGGYGAAIVVVPRLAPDARYTVRDTVVVDAAPPALAVSPASRGDSIDFGAPSLDSVWVMPEGAGTTGQRWVMSPVAGFRIVPLNRNWDYRPGSGIGNGWLVYGRNTAGRAPGVYVDTITVKFEAVNLTGTAQVVDRLVVMTGETAPPDTNVPPPQPDPVIIVGDSVRPAATMGTAYATMLQATGDSGAAKRWALVAGTMPPGIALDSLTGAVAGVPEAAGVFAFTVRARGTRDSTLAAVRGFAVQVVEPVLAAAAVTSQLLTGTGLTPDHRRYLDLLGNRNGRVDIGDVSVWRAKQ